MNIYTLIIWLFFTIFIVDSASVASKSNSISLNKISPKHYLKEVHQLYKDYFMLKYQNIYVSDQDELASAKKRISGNVNLTLSAILGYYGEITIGNQTFNTLFDLGSSDLWTFKPIGTPFSIEYGPSSVIGITGKDNVLVGGIKSVAQIFGLAQEADGDLFIEAEYDGIFGMGFDALSEIKTTTPFSNMVKQKAVTNPYFGLYLQRSNDHGDVGTLTLGDIDTTKFTGNLNYNNVSTTDGEYKYWIIDVDDISINGNNLKFKNRKAILDTGNDNINAI
ncbi:acid protease [Gigaspora margarita]|uniref:Acid protease n=1 Tax=Gigaspora margarita TaxID=4874 RepID=A0A8H4A4D3_GIGMA|nr:acid protease [Gigaspora margarita]